MNNKDKQSLVIADLESKGWIVVTQPLPDGSVLLEGPNGHVFVTVYGEITNRNIKP